ncbi:MAG TPA: 2-succinyl-5-enolpyruvyl-6-hydroxy-3-cyclohexene-1-carboxylic-acid synthase [Ohtaekwangia sp.]|nr:2-succinyl-5-enolpyruvyl-6-hydroxy-3-cyclohexene-1-carboxylic-acid synthase [Ohtaekwangia sp.]
MLYQPIYDIAELCVRKNIRQVVLCPGSRCAPLTLAFTRHPQITTRTFSDERTAGFVALGMAQSLGAPVAIVCTSGTAVYNLAPAVAEAWFSNTPLVVITADRPAEWIGQHDGQTIYQSEIFGKHVKEYYQLPQDYDHDDSQWAINRMMNEAINVSSQVPRGPVHINAPFREPLYPAKGDNAFHYGDVRVIKEHTGSSQLTTDAIGVLKSRWVGFHNVLVVCGQHPSDVGLRETLSNLQRNHNLPVVHDVISNLHEAGDTIQHSDLFLGQASNTLKEMLRPDLLITIGDSLISKNLKIFLRKYAPAEHWHVQPQGRVADTFMNVTDVFFVSPQHFFDVLGSIPTRGLFEGQKQKNYYNLWNVEERRVLQALDAFFQEGNLTELSLVRTLLASLPENSNLHLANSMSVRYANFIGLHPTRKDVRVFANRGTSGIEGSTSTAVGHALVSDRPNFLITGDLAFFYDRNAFWHNYPLGNLRVLLLNNHGGLIFDVLEGPSSTPEAGEYFITRQKLNARKLCEEFNLDYLKVDHVRRVSNLMKDFLTADSGTKVMELETDTASNKQVLENLKSKIKNSYEL